MAVTPKPPAEAAEPSFRTLSGEPVRELYTPADLPAGIDGPEDPIGLPGSYPFTRGIYESMYRGRLWTMRQFAGFGTSEETNERFRYLLEPRPDRPVDRLRHALADGPRLRPRARLGEVGREGVAIDTLDDMRTLFSGIDLGEVSVSMTINAPAAIMLAFYVAAAEADPLGRGGPIPPERLSGTIQADILKEYIAQKEWCFPIDPAMRLCGDMIEWCTRHMPRWHPISISGYHIREAGSTAQQELAFTLKDGLTYVEQAVERGLDVDRVRSAPVLLLQRPDRLLRGDRQVPRGAAHLGARAARDVRREGPALVADALSRPDRRRVADRAAAAQQHRAHGDRGARGGPRRHPVAAHELLRRGARAADRGGGDDRTAHPAGDRARDRRDEHRGPARRLLLRRGADRSHGGARLRVLHEDRRAGRHGRGGQAQLPPARDRRRRLRAAAGDRRGRADRGGRQQLHRG